MKILAIAWKDLLSSFRSLIGLAAMILIPLLITGMFYFMFGRIASEGDFNLAPTKLVIANLDEGGPRFNISTDNIPNGSKADTMGELIVLIAQSEDLAALLDVTLIPDAAMAEARLTPERHRSRSSSHPISPNNFPISMDRRRSSFTRIPP